MDEKVFVSVLTPVYKHDIEYVRQCFESLQNQTMQNIEFLLIDNGATEESKELIEEFVNKDSRFKAIHIEVNEGYGKAMNRGIREARGEYIGIVESDDTIEPNMYEDLYNIALETQVDVVKGEFYVVENGEKKEKLHYNKGLYNRIITDLPYNFPGFASGHVSHWSAIYNREFLIRNNIIFNEDINTGIQDFGFISRLMLYINSLYMTPVPYLNYTMDNPNSSISQRWNMVKKVIREHQYISDLYDRENAEAVFWEITAKGKYMSYMFHLHNNVKGHSFEFIRAVSKQFRYIMDEKGAQLLLLPHKDRKVVKNLAYHPISFYMSFFIKNFIGIFYKNKISKVSRKVTFLGIPLYDRRQFAKYIHYKYLCSLFKIKKYNYYKKFYLLGIMFYKHVSLTKCIELHARQILANNKAIKNELRKVIRCDLKTIAQCQQLHKETFGPYKNAFLGKDVVLVASGPTSQYHTQKDGCIYVGVNNACLLENVKLDYLFCQDFYMDEEKKNAIVDYRPGECQKFFGRIPDDRYNFCLNKPSASHVRRCPKYLIDRANAKEYYVQDNYNNSFALDIENEPLNLSGIVFAAMQFILHCHPKRIYLVGCDCSSGFFYQSNITFDNNGQIAVWQMLKEHMAHIYPDIEVISLNPVGLKGMFKEEFSENYLESLALQEAENSEEENDEEYEEEMVGANA